MGRYKLIISEAISGEEKDSVMFDEKVQEESKAQSYRILLNEAANYADGEYIGQLYRRNNLKLKWEEVVGAPLIACQVKSGKASLTVERVVYGKEESLLKRLLDIHVTLGSLRADYLECLNSPKVLDPKVVLDLIEEVVTIIESLHSDYQPEYLTPSVYPEIVSVLKKISEAIKISYGAYANTPLSDNYTTEIAKRIGEIQLSIQSVLESLNIDGITK